MKKFLKKLIGFSAIIILVFACAIIWRTYACRTLDFSFPENKTELFVGASQPYWAIDTTLIQSAINFSKAGEGYMYTYLKLKKLLEDNPHIKNVFIQCSPSDIVGNQDKTYFNDNEMGAFMPSFYSFYTAEEWLLYKNHKTQAIRSMYQKALRPGGLFVDKWDFGGQVSKKEGVKSKFDSNKARPKTALSPNPINIHYLHKILELCESHGTKLYAICFPAYKPEEYYDINEFNRIIKTEFPKLDFIDYTDFSVSDNERYDHYHLNWYGAQKFTKEIKQRFNIE